MDRRLEHELIDLGIAVAAADKDGRHTLVDLVGESCGVVIFEHRVARAVVEHVARVDDEVGVGKVLIVGKLPALLAAVRIADDADFHDLAPSADLLQ